MNDDQDANHSRDNAILGMEGIVRQTLTKFPQCALIMVMYVNESLLKAADNGEDSVSIAAHTAVAQHYGITTVNLARELSQAINTRQWSWDAYGGVHPNKNGYQLSSNLICLAIEKGLQIPPGESPLPQPLNPFHYGSPEWIPATSISAGPEWEKGTPQKGLLPTGSIRKEYKDYPLLRSDQPGAKLDFSFHGHTVGAFLLAGPDAGIIETRIDGEEWIRHDLYHRYSKSLNYPRSVIFHHGLTSGDHKLELRIASDKNPESKGHALNLLYFATAK